jgi:hypothetical protein
MTYRQKHDLLLELVNKKWKIFEEKDQEIFNTQGAADFDLQAALQKSFSEWQQASNDANSFLILFKNSGKHPDDVI